MINNFRKKYGFLSNFYNSKITIKNRIYPTVEHAFQAYKADNFEDHKNIAMASTPVKSKRLGNKCSMRKDWEDVKFKIMYKLVYLKFKQNKDLKERLLQTGYEELIEGNKWHDNIWGNCSCTKCENINGTNWLGVILMKVREKVS